MRGLAFGLLAACAAPSHVAPPQPTARPAAPAAPQRTWRPIATPAPFTAALPTLLTDGTVMIQDLSTTNMWRLTPDEFGSYEHGTWSQRASLPEGYTPLYYASAVLPDGRYVMQGGEYIDGTTVWTTRGAIYDPRADEWRGLTPPAGPGWSMIGDASGMVLANGAFMLSACCSTATALLDPNSLAYLDFGRDKADVHDEESWVMLRDGSILTVDANNTADLSHTEILDPHTGTWTSAGETPVQISDTNPDGSGSHEVGPNVLLADGRVLAIGGNGHNVIYDPTAKTWTQLPDMPMRNSRQLDIADGPAAMLPNGNVLMVASPGVFDVPSYVLEYDGTQFIDAPRTPDCAGGTSYQFAMLLLPTGEVLMTAYSPDVELYTPAAGVVPDAIPVITGIGEVGMPLRSGAEGSVIELYTGATYLLEGKRLSGISQGSYYGDDEQSYTNYPLVRLTNAATQHVHYLFSHDESSRIVGPDAQATTLFDVPADAEPGASMLEVVANGVASPPIAVDVK